MNISRVINIIDYKLIIQEDEMLNAKATIGFLRRVEEAYPTKKRIHLFCDNARYYRNKEVIKYLETSKIHMHFLPPYSPNLNPIERLWKWMKERVIYNTYYPEFEDFKTSVFGFFEALAGLSVDSILGREFRKRIRDRFRPLAAPI